MNFTGKKILVTGGTRGIGLAISQRLSDYGAIVTVTGRSEENPTPYDYVQADFSAEASCVKLLEVMEETNFYGVVNNAGINDIHPIEEFPKESFQEIFEVNFTSVYKVLQAAARSFKKHKTTGRIVNIGSIWSTNTKVGRSAYCATKAGVAGMTRGVSVDLASSGVLVNTVSPGFIETELTARTMGEQGIKEVSAQIPMGRLGQPEEIAEVVSFLLSSNNTYLTGQNITVDGGFTNV